MTGEQIAAALHLLAFVVVLIATGLVLYHASQMLNHIKPARQNVANLLGAFAPLAGSIYDEVGLAHRASLTRVIVVLLLAGAVALGTALYLGIIPNGYSAI